MMNKTELIKISVFSLLLLSILFFYYSLGFLSFSNVNVNEKLPKANKANKQTIIPNQQIGSVDSAKQLSLGFELVGIRGNNPESTIIILDKNNYKLIEQGENISNQISFSHVEGSRAYFFDGKDYSFLDLVGFQKSLNQDRIDLIKD